VSDFTRVSSSSQSLFPQSAEHTVAAGLFYPLVETVKHWGVTAEQLLGPFGLRMSDVAEPHARLPHSLHLAIIDRARALTEEPALGIFWGLQIRASVFGYLGFATTSAATLRDAIELAVQFAPLASTAEGMRLHVEGNQVSLFLEDRLGTASVRDVITLARLVSLWRIGETITGRALHASAEVAFPEPAYFARFSYLAPAVRFDRPATRAIISAEALDYPLVSADPMALRLAAEQCGRELLSLSGGGRLVRTVRGLLWKSEGGLRSPAEVAGAMHMSPRTLRRKLESQGQSLSALFDRERRDRALSLLASPELSLLQIAERLGYRNVQSFDRAFRRWTGTTPAAHRRL
jgi:AraC-like DNA-binding protein